MGIAVLGPLTVDGSGRLGPRDRVVLQALVTRLGQPVSADELIDAVWRDHPPASAAKNLQSCVVRLRKALGARGHRDDGGRIPPRRPPRRGRRPPVRVAGRAGASASGARRGRPGRVPAGTGPRALAGGGLRGTRGVAARAPRGRTPGGAAPRRPGAAARCPAAMRPRRRGPAPRARDGAVGPVARTPLGAARAGAVPRRRAGRGTPDHPAAPGGAGRRARHRPGPGGGGPRAVDPAAGSLARRARARVPSRTGARGWA